MKTIKFPPSSRDPTGLSLPATRKYIRPRVEQIVREWRQQNPALLTRSASHITFLNDFGLRREANGRLHLFAPVGGKHICKEANVSVDGLLDWLHMASFIKIRLLVLDELTRRTGKSGLGIHDLGYLEPLCSCFRNILLGDANGKVDLTPIAMEFSAFLDPDVLDLTRRARDTITSLATYNIIAANLSTWKSLEAQTPGLMPLVSYSCRKKLIHFDCTVFRSLKQYGRNNGLTEAGRRYANSLFNKFVIYCNSRSMTASGRLSLWRNRDDSYRLHDQAAYRLLFRAQIANRVGPCLV